MQSGAVAESAAGVDGGLGATEPVVFEWLLRRESLVPVVQDHRGGAAVGLPLNLHVRVVDDDGG